MARAVKRTVKQWAALITADWRSSLKGIIAAGKHLAAAKAQLNHGQFGQLETQLPFSARTAQRLIAIAADDRLTNPTHASLLPPHWATLYELTQLSDKEFEGRIADGTIKPEMERAAIVQIAKIKGRAERELTLAMTTDSISKSRSSEMSKEDWPRYGGIDGLRVGRAAEHIVCADGLMRGWNAFLAGQGTPYDVVFEKEGRMLRLQIKASQVARNVNSQGLNERIAYSFSARRRGKNGQGRLSNDHADLIACVALDIGAIAYLPVADCSTTIQLEPHEVRENGYIRSYERPIGKYPLETAIAKLDNEHHYVALKKIFPPFPRRLFNVIYADCPWNFGTWSEQGKDRSADNHYPTLDTEILCGIGPYVPAADEAVLFLWATAPMLPDAMRVMQAWAFIYKSCIAWEKDRIGTGFWARNKHELLLIGTRGSIPAPAPGSQPVSVIEAPLEKHSQKPAIFAEMIERLFPNCSKLEMFARGSARPGWAAWGNEAEETTKEAAE